MPIPKSGMTQKNVEMLLNFPSIEKSSYIMNDEPVVSGSLVVNKGGKKRNSGSVEIR